MQTFVPVWDIVEISHILDPDRLFNQAKEVMQIHDSLTGISRGWTRHPARQMWRGHEPALIFYGFTMLKEAMKQGVMCQGSYPWFYDEWEKVSHDILLPSWWGDERISSSHRSNLLRKNPEWYSKFGWPEGPDLEYFWPGREK